MFPHCLTVDSDHKGGRRASAPNSTPLTKDDPFRLARPYRGHHGAAQAGCDPSSSTGYGGLVEIFSHKAAMDALGPEGGGWQPSTTANKVVKYKGCWRLLVPVRLPLSPARPSARPRAAACRPHAKFKGVVKDNSELASILPEFWYHLACSNYVLAKLAFQ